MSTSPQRSAELDDLHELDESVEFALQCVLAARLELDEVAAGDEEALRLLTSALDRATEKLYAARRRRNGARPSSGRPSAAG